MGLISLIYLEGKVIYKCECNAHLTHGDFLDSKNYRAESGKAYLFSKVYKIIIINYF